ncbi:MAG: tandem-95 repeat protein, partial [Planctomycetales bacterium]|nr:tandem-95 repeat protein [Planctomycetales bacterium]
TGPQNGTLNLSDNGAFTYQPNTDFVGQDSFTYTAIVDGTASNVATVTIDVLAQNAAPIANDDSYTTDEDTALVTSTSVLANDTDDDGDTLTASLVSGPSNGTLTLETNGQFTYTPDADFNGTDSFTYTATDGTATSDPATVTIQVDAVNDAPVATGESYSVATDGTLQVDVNNGVLANDT